MGNYQNNPVDLSFGSLDLSKITIGIVVSEWNSEVTEALFSSAVETLIDAGCAKENIISEKVPGSYELTLGCQWLAQKDSVDAVIALGCVIQGETPHFTFICDAVAQGLTRVSLDTNKPVIFGVLTTNTHKQALDRAGGKHGNKGMEAAATALKMLALQKRTA